MNIKNHIKLARSYLSEANKQVDAGNYKSARACLADAFYQNRRLLDHVLKLCEQEQANKHSAGETTG